MQRDLILQWDSTNKCNLNCIHCYHNYSKRQKEIMDLKKVKNMLNDMVYTSKDWSLNPRFQISGGEALLRKDLFQIIEYANFNSIETRILTNGTLLTKEYAKKLSDLKINGIQVSIDGSENTHNKIRNNGNAYKKSIEGIKNAVSQGIDVTVSMTAMKSNVSDLENVIQKTIESGANSFGFQSYVPNPLLGKADPEYLGPNETFSLFLKAERLKEKYKDKINVLQGEVLWNLRKEDTELKKFSREKMQFLGGCSAGYFSLSVLSNGDVYPCRRLPIKIGKIKEGIKKLILESEIMRNLRNLNKLKENSKCSMVTHCRGCRAVAYAVTGDYMARDPMCFKHLIEDKNGKY